ncbi:MAG: rhomboid family intramembrane serine protease [Lachnospiraceae bacterium]|nr:rhomboid family intramembrane serine protease [Lachnospiraceae bacterium]
MDTRWLKQQWFRLKLLPYITIFLVTANVIIFLICTFTGEMLYNVGELSPKSFLEDGRYFGIVTAIFLHADIHHLANNMLLLAGLGMMMEKDIGHLKFAVLYFAAGLGGSVVSLSYKLFTDEWYVSSIGASGAVFGLVGALLAMVLCRTESMPNVTWQRILIVIAYSLYSGMRTDNIDNAGHIGGFLAGFLAGLLICVFRKKLNKKSVFNY